jgi:hypothetical protein
VTDNKPAKRGPGKPFVKGDPRINHGGNLNRAAQTYEILFRNALAQKLTPQEFAAIVIEDVRRHRPGAKEFYADRLMGKVTQPVNGKVSVDGKLIVEVIKT